MAKTIKRWKVTPEDKRLEINADGIRVEVDCDGEEDEEAASMHLANDIADLPRLKRIRELVKALFGDGVLGQHPTSDGAPEYELRILTGWRG